MRSSDASFAECELLLQYRLVSYQQKNAINAFFAVVRLNVSLSPKFDKYHDLVLCPLVTTLVILDLSLIVSTHSLHLRKDRR